MRTSDMRPGKYCRNALLVFLASVALEVPVSSELLLQERLEIVQKAHECQSSMFQNVRFNWTTSGPRRVAEKGGEDAQAPVIRPIPEETEKCEYSYQLNKDGRFRISCIHNVTNERTGETYQSIPPWTLSFDGQEFRNLSYDTEKQGGLASLFLPEHPYDQSAPLIKPTFYMDHLFNEKVQRALSDGSGLTFTESEDGLWQFRWESRESGSKDFLNIYCDPDSGFAVTRLEGIWNGDRTFRKDIIYARTEDGFFFPQKGTLEIAGDVSHVLRTDEFELNGEEDGYVLEIPVGVRVTDHTKGGLPVTYFEGQPGKESTLPGDHSIATLADRLDRLVLEDVEERMAAAGLEPGSDESLSESIVVDPPSARTSEEEGTMSHWILASIVVMALLLPLMVFVFLIRKSTKKRAVS